MDFEIKNGFVIVEGEPKAYFGTPTVSKVSNAHKDPKDPNLTYYASSTRPFLTPITIPLDTTVSIVSDKLLVAPRAAVLRKRLRRLIPFSFKNALRYHDVTAPWAVACTRSRVERIVLAEGETATLVASSLVAWSGNPPNGFIPRLRLRDIFQFPSVGRVAPRPPCLHVRFFGPAVIYFEGGI